MATSAGAQRKNTKKGAGKNVVHFSNALSTSQSHPIPNVNLFHDEISKQWFEAKSQSKIIKLSVDDFPS